MDSHQASPALTFFSLEHIAITKPPSSSPLLPSYFTMAQRQELELQALICKYMVAGVSVPLELVQPLKRSLLHAQLLRQYVPVAQTGESGRCPVGPEPGRCRRTDGKKWRCSREVMAGHKYCERHIHRGRSRSGKPVETAAPTSINGSKASASAKAKYLNLSGSFLRSGSSSSSNSQLQELKDEEKHEGYVLQRFFDEWPESRRESDEYPATRYTGRPASSPVHAGRSSAGHAASDFSLMLSTGNSDPPNNSTWSGWVHRGEESMGGGPLAEALSSSLSTCSPTSVLHKPSGSASESSSIGP